MNQLVFKVEGMKCEGCEKRLSKALTTFENITKVEADHKTGTVAILFDKQIDENQVKENIENLGFIVKE